MPIDPGTSGARNNLMNFGAIAEVMTIMAAACLIIFIIIMLIAHFFSYDKHTDSMGTPGKKYKKFLERKERIIPGMDKIPPPPNGERDDEVEVLLIEGNYKAANELLIVRMEEACLAPVGSSEKIARVSHYIELMKHAMKEPSD